VDYDAATLPSLKIVADPKHVQHLGSKHQNERVLCICRMGDPGDVVVVVAPPAARGSEVLVRAANPDRQRITDAVVEADIEAPEVAPRRQPHVPSADLEHEVVQNGLLGHGWSR
jgi:hypothetical protein